MQAISQRYKRCYTQMSPYLKEKEMQKEKQLKELFDIARDVKKFAHLEAELLRSVQPIEPVRKSRLTRKRTPDATARFEKLMHRTFTI